MRTHVLNNFGCMVLTTAVGVWCLVLTSTSVYGQHGNHQAPASAGHQAGSGHDAHTGHDQDARAPHGGQLTLLKPLSVEIVYLPREIRVYLYNPFPKVSSAKGVKGEVVLQQRDDPRETKVALRHVAPKAGEQDYLSGPAELRDVKEGQLTATIKLENTLLQARSAKFSQPVVLSKPQLEVTVVALEASDKELVARQKVCPVSGAPLNSMGGPVKVLVGDQPLFLCCKGCLGSVQSDPEGSLRKASQRQ